VDAVATQPGVNPPVNGNTGESLTCKIAFLQIKTPLHDIYAITFSSAYVP
jgi:hypothetical protein